MATASGWAAIDMPKSWYDSQNFNLAMNEITHENSFSF